MNTSRPPAGRPSAGGRTLPQVRESLGAFFHQLGMPPIAGRMLAWLALSESGCDSLDAMAGALKASKASVSSMARLLAERGFVERVPVLERRDCYRLRADAWENVLRTRLAAIASAKGLADEGLLAARGGRAPRPRAPRVPAGVQRIVRRPRARPAFVPRARARTRGRSPLPARLPTPQVKTRRTRARPLAGLPATS
ncbi:GbsR/MarR family transcriptional regulator [Archangium gephyra]|uniref:GbsR/MarR family transcriptional regulator n=1 Tax=Archangium gephyra TaxID=48 RepID=UPI003B80F3F4